MIDFFNDMTYVGIFPEGDDFASSTVGSIETGMLVKLQVKWVDNVVTNIRYKVYGNQFAIASMAFVAHWMIGKTRDEINALDHQAVVDALSIPPINLYCAVLAREAVTTVL